MSRFKIWPYLGVCTGGWAPWWVLAHVKLRSCLPVKLGAQLCLGGVQPPTTSSPSALSLQVWGEDGLSFSWIPCAVWSMTCRARFHHLAGCPCQKRAPNYTPFFSFCPGRVGQGACHPLPFLASSPAQRSSAALPHVRGAGSIRDVPVMNASPWNCGCVSQAWCSRTKM